MDYSTNVCPMASSRSSCINKFRPLFVIRLNKVTQGNTCLDHSFRLTISILWLDLGLHGLNTAAVLSYCHPSFLFCKRHNTHAPHSPPPPPSSVCQCPSTDHTAHCVHFKDLRAINPRWWQLTPHNHQGRDNNFFVRNHLCSEQLLSRCQCSFHALRCGLYLALCPPFI